MHLQIYHNRSSRTHHDTPTSLYCCLMQLEPAHSGNMWPIFSRSHMLATVVSLQNLTHVKAFEFRFLAAMCGHHWDNHQLRDILCDFFFFLQQEAANLIKSLHVSRLLPSDPWAHMPVFLYIWPTQKEEASQNLTTCHTGHSLCLYRLQVQRYGSFPTETNGGCIAVGPTHELSVCCYQAVKVKPSTQVTFRPCCSPHRHIGSNCALCIYIERFVPFSMCAIRWDTRWNTYKII